MTHLAERRQVPASTIRLVVIQVRHRQHPLLSVPHVTTQPVAPLPALRRLVTMPAPLAPPPSHGLHPLRNPRRRQGGPSASTNTCPPHRGHRTPTNTRPLTEDTPSTATTPARPR